MSMEPESCKRALKVAMELLEEECGIDSLAGLLGLEEGSALSEKCDEALEKGIDKETCQSFSTLRIWVLCRAWKINDTQKVGLKLAMSMAWDEAENTCKGFVPEEHQVPQ